MGKSFTVSRATINMDNIDIAKKSSEISSNGFTQFSITENGKDSVIELKEEKDFIRGVVSIILDSKEESSDYDTITSDTSGLEGEAVKESEEVIKKFTGSLDENVIASKENSYENIETYVFFY